MQKKIIAATLFMQAWVFPSMAIEPSNSSLVKRREALQYIAEPLGELESCLGDCLDSLLKEKAWAYEAIKNPDIIISYPQIILSFEKIKNSKNSSFKEEGEKHFFKILGLLELIKYNADKYNKDNKIHLDLTCMDLPCMEMIRDELKKYCQKADLSDFFTKNAIKNIYSLLLKIKPLMECIRDEEEVPLKDSKVGVYHRDLCAINKALMNALDIAMSEYCSIENEYRSIEKETESGNYTNLEKEFQLKDQMSEVSDVQKLLNDSINCIERDIDIIKEIFKNNLEFASPHTKRYLKHIHMAMDTGCNFHDQVSLDENIQALSTYFSADDTSSAYTEEIAKYFKEKRKEVILAETIHELENLKLYIDNNYNDNKYIDNNCIDNRYVDNILLITKKLKEAQEKVEKAWQKVHIETQDQDFVNSQKEDSLGWEDFSWEEEIHGEI